MLCYVIVVIAIHVVEEFRDIFDCNFESHALQAFHILVFIYFSSFISSMVGGHATVVRFLFMISFIIMKQLAS